jgi:hypothetical protein
MDGVMTLTLVANDGRLIVRGPRVAEPLAKTLLARKTELMPLLALGPVAVEFPASQTTAPYNSLTADEAATFVERLAIATVDGRLIEEEAVCIAWVQIQAHRRKQGVNPG